MRTFGWLAIWSGLAIAISAGATSGDSKKRGTAPAARAVAAADAPSVPSKPTAERPSEAFQTVTLRGRIVWLGEALERLYSVQHDDQDAKTAIAFETDDGRLVPIVKDARGRGFWLDERLHAPQLELFVRQYPSQPWVQVIRVYTVHDGEKFELDYWCDICAIPMFELKPCECCQGETRLRERAANGDERQSP